MDAGRARTGRRRSTTSGGVSPNWAAAVAVVSRRWSRRGIGPRQDQAGLAVIDAAAADEPPPNSATTSDLTRPDGPAHRCRSAGRRATNRSAMRNGSPVSLKMVKTVARSRPVPNAEPGSAYGDAGDYLFSSRIWVSQLPSQTATPWDPQVLGDWQTRIRVEDQRQSQRCHSEGSPGGRAICSPPEPAPRQWLSQPRRTRPHFW